MQAMCLCNAIATKDNMKKETQSSSLSMRSQWECLLQNVGEWQGSFTRFSPQGELIENTPTVVSLEGIDNNQTMRQIIRRTLPNQSIDEKVLQYSTLGKQILFFENGAFSQGSIQLAPYSEFGAEHGLIAGDRRLRLVQLFDKTGNLDRITLIREKLPHSTTPERPALQVADLVGQWQGEAITRYPDGQVSDTYPTKLRIEKTSDTQLVQHLSIMQQGSHHTISSTGRIAGSVLSFETGSQWNQVLLLPDGASAASPQHVRIGQAFFLELGWLIQSHMRQRIIRRYNDKGEWYSLTLVTETKVG
ncbi:hypothetical protein Glo7428_3397 [Gloeocapsa sp. PCC 7428]|nr:hypothetical protein Glo7428_3397 [Gloeocapsa sp. PCC 7428]